MFVIKVGVPDVERLDDVVQRKAVGHEAGEAECEGQNREAALLHRPLISNER